MKYLRQKEVCELLRISESAFRDIRYGDFPKGIQILPSVLLWVEEEVHEWVMRQKRMKTTWD